MKRDPSWQPPPQAKPATEQYLASITVGERIPHNDRIQLVPYDPRWPALYDLAAGRVMAALSDTALLLEHVGSTAVPGLRAKPMIDMLLAVQDSADEASYLPTLEAQGFALHAREPDWFQHRFLVMNSGDNRWQLHVFSAGCEEIDRMVAFRDWLRTHDADRRLYETTKVELAARRWKHVQNYADAKSELVRQILVRAHGGVT